jgi:hypothetical protein
MYLGLSVNKRTITACLCSRNLLLLTEEIGSDHLYDITQKTSRIEYRDLIDEGVIKVKLINSPITLRIVLRKGRAAAPARVNPPFTLQKDQYIAFTMSFRDGHSLAKYVISCLFFLNFRPKLLDPLSFLSLVNLSYFCFSPKLTCNLSARSSYQWGSHINVYTFQTFPTFEVSIPPLHR